MGDILALLSAIAWASANVIIGVGQRRNAAARSADSGAFLSILLTAALAGAVWVVSGGGRPWESPAALRGTVWFGVAGVLTIFVGRVFLYSSVRSLGPVRASSLKRLLPFFSVLLGVLVLGEALSPMLLAGMVLIFGGFVVLLRESRAASVGDLPLTPAQGAARSLAHLGFFYGTVSALAYAAGNVARKYGIDLLPDAAFGAMFGAVVGAVLFLLTALFAKSYAEAVRSTFTGFNPWFWSAGLLSSAGQILFFMAIDLSTLSRAAMIVSTEVFLTLILTVIFVRRQDKVTLAVVLAAALGGIGTIVILADRSAEPVGPRSTASAAAALLPPTPAHEHDRR
jgi:drug/metabolite transporter (DMT)-like permease